MSETKSWQIRNRTTGMDLGRYQGATEEEALDAMARDAGYDSYADSEGQAADLEIVRVAYPYALEWHSSEFGGSDECWEEFQSEEQAEAAIPLYEAMLIQMAGEDQGWIADIQDGYWRIYGPGASTRRYHSYEYDGYLGARLIQIVRAGILPKLDARYPWEIAYVGDYILIGGDAPIALEVLGEEENATARDAARRMLAAREAQDRAGDRHDLDEAMAAENAAWAELSQYEVSW